MNRTQRKVLYRTTAVLVPPLSWALAGLTSWLVQAPGPVNIMMGVPFGIVGWIAAYWLWTEVD